MIGPTAFAITAEVTTGATLPKHGSTQAISVHGEGRLESQTYTSLTQIPPHFWCRRWFWRQRFVSC